MKKAKQFLALTLSAALAAGMMAGCAQAPAKSTAASTAPASSAAAAEPIKVSVAIWGADEGLSDPNDPILKKIE